VLRILVVEDSPTNLALIRKILRRMNYEVIEAVNGVEALRMTEQQNPDIIVMDLHLPDVSGLELTQQIKNQVHSKHIPIIAVTADIHARKEFRSVGGDAYLNKPVRKAPLLRAIRQLVATSGSY